MMLPPPPVQSSEPSEPQPQAESPSSISSGYSSIPPASAPDFPFFLPEPSNLDDLLSTEVTFPEKVEPRLGMSDLMRSQVMGENSDLSDLAKLGLLHEERLLCKDKVRRLSSSCRPE